MIIGFEDAQTAITLIAKSPELIKELDMPNFNFPTMGGKRWWRDIANCNGWRIQQNSVTKHCRILDPDNIRRGWGGEEAMLNLFDKIIR